MDIPQIPKEAFTTMAKTLVVCGTIIIAGSTFANSERFYWLFVTGFIMIIFGVSSHYLTYQSETKT